MKKKPSSAMMTLVVKKRRRTPRKPLVWIAKIGHSEGEEDLGHPFGGPSDDNIDNNDGEATNKSR